MSGEKLKDPRKSRGDPRAQWKSLARRSPRCASVLQWIFDPAFTPSYLIRHWVRRQPGYVLNLGSGSRFLGQNVVNLDMEEFAHVHVVNRSERLPFKDGSFEAVLLEYVLEHVESCDHLIREVTRILKPGGSVLVTVPFRQSYHGCPRDFWRFTHEGVEAFLQRNGLHSIRVDVYGGPASAWIDATKEFLSTLLSLGFPSLYGILSQLLILPFLPLRYLDLILRHLPAAKYTAFSFRVAADKPGVLAPEERRSTLAAKIEDSLRNPEGSCIQRRGGRWWVEPDPRALSERAELCPVGERMK